MDGGRSFAPPVRVSSDGWRIEGCPEDGPAVTFDAVGRAHLVWPSVVNGQSAYKAIFYAVSEPGGGFAACRQVSPPTRWAEHPAVAVDAKGKPSAQDRSG